MKKVFLCIIAIVVILSYFYYKNSGINGREQAPDFETILVDGSVFRLSNLRGKYVLLDF